jgi:hypothetical protein
MNAGYVLEVQKFVMEPLEDKGFYRIGYMNKIFTTKKQAIRYYDSNNSHLRSINIFNNCISDWDPNSFLRYRIREYYGEHLSIPPF